VAESRLPPTPPPPPTAGALTLVESWPTETTLDNPHIPDAHEVWPALIAGAETSLDLSQFYISDVPDSRLGPVLDAVREAAARGVAVRLLADAKFYKTYPELLDELGALDNIEMRLYDMKPLTGGVQHAKYFLIDGRTTYLGSHNFDYRALEHIVELGVQIDSRQFTGFYQHIFDLDWALAGGATVEEAMGAPADVSPFPLPLRFGESTALATPVGSPESLLPTGGWELPVIVEAIEGAEERVRVQLLSYAVVGYDKSEWRLLDDAFRAAAARGVTVELLVANWSKKGSKLASLKSLQQVEGITVRFANIPEHSEGFIPFSRVIHSKLLVVDQDWAWVGTSNWSKDYFHGSRNVGLVLEGAEAGRQLNDYFGQIWLSEYCETVDPEAEYSPPKRR